MAIIQTFIDWSEHRLRDMLGKALLVYATTMGSHVQSPKPEATPNTTITAPQPERKAPVPKPLQEGLPYLALAAGITMARRTKEERRHWRLLQVTANPYRTRSQPITTVDELTQYISANVPDFQFTAHLQKKLEYITFNTPAFVRTMAHAATLSALTFKTLEEKIGLRSPDHAITESNKKIYDPVATPPKSVQENDELQLVSRKGNTLVYWANTAKRNDPSGIDALFNYTPATTDKHVVARQQLKAEVNQSDATHEQRAMLFGNTNAMHKPVYRTAHHREQRRRNIDAERRQGTSVKDLTALYNTSTSTAYRDLRRAKNEAMEEAYRIDAARAHL